MAVLRGSAAAGNGSGAEEPAWLGGCDPSILSWSLVPATAHPDPAQVCFQPGIPKGCSSTSSQNPQGFELEGTWGIIRELPLEQKMCLGFGIGFGLGAAGHGAGSLFFSQGNMASTVVPHPGADFAAEAHQIIQR